MSYAFRNTYRQDNDTYVEDRGYPYAVARGDEGFDDIDRQFGTMLAVGQTALHGDGEGIWNVVDGFPMLDESKGVKLEALHKAWLQAEAEGVVQSSAGFPIDATERANRDVTGLITAMEASGTENTMFCAADNTFHNVTLKQLQAMRLEIIQHAQALYARKWELRTAIGQAQSFDALNAVAISFEGV